MPWKCLIAITWLIILLCLAGFWIMGAWGRGGLGYTSREANLEIFINTHAGSLLGVAYEPDSVYSINGWAAWFDASPQDNRSLKSADSFFGPFHYINDEMQTLIEIPFWFLTLLHTTVFALLYLFIHRRQQRHRLDLPDPRP